MRKFFFILLIVLIAFNTYSQKSAEFTIGIGYPAVDLYAIVDQDEISGTVLMDWAKVSYGFSGQYFFSSLGNVEFGAELMYQYLYWYYVRVLNGTTTSNPEYDVNVFRITPIARFRTDSPFALDIGPEFNFSNGIRLGLLVSANYDISLTDKIDIPLKARLDIMNRIVMTMPISINAGIRIKL
ncbi:MAG: hypothetical protein GY816_10700 [Cytophagales bacterium]|nr:hypothetical protein [Cytophagales bacterium]